MRTHFCKTAGLLFLMGFSFAGSSYAADWVVQVSSSSRVEWLNEQAKKLSKDFTDVRVVSIDGDAKLVVGQFPSPREASATLNRIRTMVPGAFLRQLEASTATASNNPSSASYIEPAVTYSENNVVRAQSATVAKPAYTYDPNLWIKR